MMRVPETDKYIEERFGKPDFSKSVIDVDHGEVLTPIGKWKLWRVDPILVFPKLKGTERG